MFVGVKELRELVAREEEVVVTSGPLRRLLAVSRCWKVRWKLFDILNDAYIS